MEATYHSICPGIFWDGLEKKLMAGHGKVTSASCHKEISLLHKFSLLLRNVLLNYTIYPELPSYRMTQLIYRHNFGQSSVLYLDIQLIDLWKQQTTLIQRFSHFHPPCFSVYFKITTTLGYPR